LEIRPAETQNYVLRRHDFIRKRLGNRSLRPAAEFGTIQQGILGTPKLPGRGVDCINFRRIAEYFYGDISNPEF
jgi:hypothetical protein